MAHFSFCPNPGCPNHRPEEGALQEKPWYRKRGRYFVRYRRNPLQRYECKSCHRTFTRRTFSTDYHMKLHIGLDLVMTLLSSGMNIRQIGRFLRCSPNTVLRRISVLARQSAALFALMMERIKLNEDFVADGFESYAVSKYFPNNFNILVGKESQFVYFSDYLQLRRKGVMTPVQAAWAEILKSLWPLPPHKEQRSFYEVLYTAFEHARRNPDIRFLTLYTDENPFYKACLDPVYLPIELHRPDFHFRHITVHSQKTRNLKNRLFAVNYMDREFRKDLAEHRRRSACFARNVNNSMERMMSYLLYHNFFKSFRINKRKRRYATHAEGAGVRKEVYEPLLRDIFSRRYFASRLELSKTLTMVWFRLFATPLKWKPESLPAYVAA